MQNFLMKKIFLFAVVVLFIQACKVNTAQLKDNKEEQAYQRRDILNQLEYKSAYKCFINLEEPEFFTAGSRLTLYGDKYRWAIVFEKSGYSAGAGTIELTYFGNCLINQERVGVKDLDTSNQKLITLTTGDEMQKIETQFEFVSNKSNMIKIRDIAFPINHNLDDYEKKGIHIIEDDNPDRLIDFASLTRYLYETYPYVFYATNNELRSCLPNNLPMIMQIYKWHHEQYDSTGRRPSDYETYSMIADILVSKDTSRWNPKLSSNTDWRNWPNAGDNNAPDNF
jgi:hypothetical protein